MRLTSLSPVIHLSTQWQWQKYKNYYLVANIEKYFKKGNQMYLYDFYITQAIGTNYKLCRNCNVPLSIRHYLAHKDANKRGIMETRKSLAMARDAKRERLIEQVLDCKDYAESHFVAFS